MFNWAGILQRGVYHQRICPGCHERSLLGRKLHISWFLAFGARGSSQLGFETS